MEQWHRNQFYLYSVLDRWYRHKICLIFLNLCKMKKLSVLCLLFTCTNSKYCGRYGILLASFIIFIAIDFRMNSCVDRISKCSDTQILFRLKPKVYILQILQYTWYFIILSIVLLLVSFWTVWKDFLCAVLDSEGTLKEMTAYVRNLKIKSEI